MNKFKKKTRSKMIAASIAILSSAAVVSTGFAAWVISGGEKQHVSGNITADSVSNNFHEIAFAKEGNDAEVFFGGPSQEEQKTNTSAWLTTVAGSKVEDLEASFTFTVSGLEKAQTNPSELFKYITLTESTTTGDETKYSTYAQAGDKQYLANLPQYDVSSKTGFDPEKPTSVGICLQSKNDFASGKQTFMVSIRFGWGTAFEGNNPFTYYNGLTKNSGNFSLANAALSELNKINASFQLTVETK